MLPMNAMDAARAAAVMVRVHGPDPKGRKMQRHAFYHSESGDTTLSASGLLLSERFKWLEIDNEDNSSIVITCASIVEPFLYNSEKSNSLKLLPGAEVDILTEVIIQRQEDRAQAITDSPRWLSARLIAIVDIPSAASALQGLLDAHNANSDGYWEIGWALTPTEGSAQMRNPTAQTSANKCLRDDGASEVEQSFLKPVVPNTSMPAKSLAKVATSVAVLSVTLPTAHTCSSLIPSEPRTRGDFILVIGSPFGALSPLHFFNSVSSGIVANCWPPESKQCSLLMADVRCLPGMEGAPVFDENGAIVGILARPLRQRGGGTEVQLVITWDALGIVFGERLKQENPQGKTIGSSIFEGGVITRAAVSSSPLVSQAMGSVVLVTVGDGSWASGVVLNSKGLILTNAHLLEPWRFGKGHPVQRMQGTDSESSQNLNASKGMRNLRLHPVPTSEASYKSYRRIRVRVDHTQQRSWHDAKVVYISKGPLDVALLQLDSVPLDLSPITPEKECPLPGSLALVIGHGIFGPRSDLSPSISSGVVARVVRADKSIECGRDECFAMLETTAAVHPGASGGAVVNERGRMIGLVTSNARHSGGTVIPHLNFSLPCAALEPVFAFASSEGSNDIGILSTMDKPNEQLSAVWALLPRTTRTLPLPTQDSTPQTAWQGKLKGSQFAKFVTEKGLLLPTNDFTKRDPVSDSPKFPQPSQLLYSRI